MLAIGCGGTALQADGGTSDAATDVASGEAGWTQCTAPGDLAVCYGTGNCHPSGCGCLFDDRGEGGALVCAGDTNPIGAPCGTATDGHVCLAPSGTYFLFDAPFDLGVLFAQNGSADRVRYADWASFTAEPLPEPDTCPQLDGLTLCGGHCGGCVSGETCTGRSPLHPYGFCNDGSNTCGSGGESCLASEGCFRFTVDTDAQALANQHGVCLPTSECQAMAARYPGGGTCLPK